MLQTRAIGSERSWLGVLEAEDPPSPKRLQNRWAKGGHGHLAEREVEGAHAAMEPLGLLAWDRAAPLPRWPSSLGEQRRGRTPHAARGQVFLKP